MSEMQLSLNSTRISGLLLPRPPYPYLHVERDSLHGPARGQGRRVDRCHGRESRGSPGDPRHCRRKWQPGAPRLRETSAGISVHRHTTAGDRCAHGWLPRLADGETQSSEDGSSQGRRCVNEFREARKRSAHVAMPVGQAGSSALSHDDRSSRVGPLATRGCSEARYTPFASDRVRDCSEYSQ